MTENFGMTNVQNVPGDTDFDLTLINDNDFVEEDRKQPEPTNKQPTGELSSSKNQTPISENPKVVPRAMSAAAAWTSYERRIY